MVVIASTLLALNRTVAMPAALVDALLAAREPAPAFRFINETVAPVTRLLNASVTVAFTLTEPEEGILVTEAPVAISVKVTTIVAGVAVVLPLSGVPPLPVASMFEGEQLAVMLKRIKMNVRNAGFLKRIIAPPKNHVHVNVNTAVDVVETEQELT